MASTSKPKSCNGKVADLLPTYPDTTWLWIDKTLSSSLVLMIM